MTPMIDVTFQLIIFFLLSSHLAQQETQMELELPTAASGQQAVDDEPAAADRERVGRRQRDAGQHARRRAKKWPAGCRIERERLGDDMEVRMRADRSVPYRAVEPILLACADAGIWNVTFAVVKRVESRAVERREPESMTSSLWVDLCVFLVIMTTAGRPTSP